MGDLMETVPTNVSGIRLGALFPQLAKQADKFSLIRSMTHRNTDTKPRLSDADRASARPTRLVSERGSRLRTGQKPQLRKA